MRRHDGSLTSMVVRKAVSLRQDLENLSFNYMRVKGCGGQSNGPLDGIDEEGIDKLMSLRDDLNEMLPFRL